MNYLSQTLIPLTTKLISTLIYFKRFQIRDQILNSPYILNNLGSFSYICWVEFPFHVLLSSSSSSLLWSRWIPPSFFTDETPPGTLWRTPELPWEKKTKKNKKKQQEGWHVTLGRKGLRYCSWLWIWLEEHFFHYILFLLCFLIR